MKPPRTASTEIDDGLEYCSYGDALDQVKTDCRPIGTEVLHLHSAVGRIAAEDVSARVSSPSADVSLKDGFAIRSADVTTASHEHPVRLKIVGAVFAGSHFEGNLTPGTAVKICSGSPIPAGATAVVAEEFCHEESGEVLVSADAQPGRNLLPCGADVKSGETIVHRGQPLLPGRLGLLAAGGIDQIKAFRKPKVAILAIGDEVVAPGHALREGQLYASNMVTIGAWLSGFGLEYQAAILDDDAAAIRHAIKDQAEGANVILTSGGAWGSERDLVVRIMDEMGWHKRFHRVRMGPGKGVAFGMWEDKPVFCLPGGPSSNEMAFLQLALPGILSLAGSHGQPFPTASARLTHEVRGRHRMWTEFKDALLTRDESGDYLVTHHKARSRLQAIANDLSLICIPEGSDRLSEGQRVPVQVLVPNFGSVADP